MIHRRDEEIIATHTSQISSVRVARVTTVQVRPYVRLASLPPGDPTALAQALAHGAAVWFEMARTAFPEPQVHALVRQFPQLLRAADKTGQTCMHVAAGRGHLALVTYFVQHGADKDAADQYGRTPLHAATESGHGAVVKYLLQQGAGGWFSFLSFYVVFSHSSSCCHLFLSLAWSDKNKADNAGVTPLGAASVYRQESVAKVIQRTSRRPSVAAVVLGLVGAALAVLGGVFLGHEYHPPTRSYLQQAYPAMYDRVVEALGDTGVHKATGKAGKHGAGKHGAGKHGAKQGGKGDEKKSKKWPF